MFIQDASADVKSECLDILNDMVSVNTGKLYECLASIEWILALNTSRGTLFWIQTLWERGPKSSP